MYGLQAPEIYSLLLKAEDSQEGQLKEEHQGHKKESRCCLQKCWINMILQRWKWREPKKQQKMKNIQAIWCNKTQNQETGYLIAMIGGHQWGWPWFWESSRERKEVCRVSDVHLVNSYLPIEQVKHINYFAKAFFLKKIFYFCCFGMFVCMLQSEQVCTDIFDLHFEDRAQSLGYFVTLHIMYWGKIFHLKLEQPTQLVELMVISQGHTSAVNIGRPQPSINVGDEY